MSRRVGYGGGGFKCGGTIGKGAIMNTPWIKIFGLNCGESLPQDALTALVEAELVIGVERVLEQVRKTEGFSGLAMDWPRPFLDIVPLIEKYREKPVVIFATGDPLWFGAASTLVRYFSPDDMIITPAPSGFQWAASRLGWPLSSAYCLTVHGRPHELVLKYLGPQHRLLILAHDKSSSMVLAKLLTESGYGEATITALGHIGSNDESIIAMSAQGWLEAQPSVPDFHVVAIQCPETVPCYYPPVPGLDDDAFESDGQLTKAEVRAITLAKLKPCHGGVLWDFGCGSGAIGIEWMRAVPETRTFGFDRRQDRLDVALRNAQALGVPEWQAVCVDYANDPHTALADYPDPDAVFIGGGLSIDLVEVALRRLKPGGRLVANVVTLESERLVLQLRAERGGNLCRINIARAEPVGALHGWRELMPVTQWAIQKST